MNDSLKELSLYVHIPFCVKKCNYCDFVSVKIDNELVSKYINVLCNEIAVLDLKYHFDKANYRLSTIYFGGGTPSILRVEDIGKIFDAVESFFNIDLSAFDGEFTLECNPCTITEEKLELYKKRGVNRLSIGLQSANNQELVTLGRAHDVGIFMKAFRLAREVGFNNINIDVMTAIPGQSMKTLKNTLDFICEFNPEHISAYSLILEENTKFYDMVNAGVIKLPDGETERLMYKETVKLLALNGYMRYEISNFAKKGFESIHNSGYWMGREYAGVGVNASSMVSNVRYKNVSSLNDYMRDTNFIDKFEERIQLSNTDLMEEYMFLGLRMSEGVDIDKFEVRFGVNMESVYGEVILRLIDKGLIVRENGRIFLSEQGVDYGNYVFSEFLLT